MQAAKGSSAKKKAALTARGVTSGKEVFVEVELADPGHGIVFILDNNGEPVAIPARADYVVNTLRNVVLGAKGVRLCIVEHFLAAAALYGLKDLKVRVLGAEMPLGDGSASMWMALFEEAGWNRQAVSASIELPEPIVCRKGDRAVMALPDDGFSASYHMDWKHPLIGKRWQMWDPTMDVKEVGSARTFGSLKEHMLLGLEDQVVSLTEDGFTQPLRFEDEPVRHKILDLIGDLALAGVNPLSIKARFVSLKGGHELDVEIARKLLPLVLDAQTGTTS